MPGNLPYSLYLPVLNLVDAIEKSSFKELISIVLLGTFL
jgi:hypothetical protein